MTERDPKERCVWRVIDGDGNVLGEGSFFETACWRSCAIDRMAEHQIRRIPIVDHEGRVVGIIAQADVARRVHDITQTARVIETVSQSNGVSAFEI